MPVRRQEHAPPDDSPGRACIHGGRQRNTCPRTRCGTTRCGTSLDQAQMIDICLKSLEVGTAKATRRIAVRAREGASADRQSGLFWLGGFKSDMKGVKAEALDQWAREQDRAMVRFDYSGHGESGGDFTAGTIGRWLEESVAVFDAFCRGPQVVIGSSMGGWLALLLVRELVRRTQPDPSVARLVLVAPA